MKILLMPVQPRSRGILTPLAERHLRGAREALKFAAFITSALVTGLAATLVLACALALALAIILGSAAALVALLVFLMVSPDGNLLFLLLLSQVWLFYAPRRTEPGSHPDGGLTMKQQQREALQTPQSFAA